MKKMLAIMLSAFVLFSGMNIVDAKNYKTYNTGDEITVNVDGTNLYKFYVISDSGSDLVALSKDVVDSSVDFGKMNYEDAINKINSLKTAWTNTSDVYLPTMQLIFGDSTSFTDSFDFTTPAYALSKTNYWTSTEFFINGETWIWTISTKLDGTGVTGISDKVSKAAVKPVINISKDHVEGAVLSDDSSTGGMGDATPGQDDTSIGIGDLQPPTEDEMIWFDFLDAYFSTDYYNEINDGTVTVSRIDNEVVFVVNAGNSDEYNFKFKYCDGVITYEPSTRESECYSLEYQYVLNAIYALSSLKNYNIDTLSDFLDSKDNFTIDQDGIEYKYGECMVCTNNDYGGTCSTSNTGKFDSFKLDVKNGIKSFNTTEDKKEETVENPKTGNFTQYGIITVAIIAVGTLGYVSIRKFNKFPQA